MKKKKANLKPQDIRIASHFINQLHKEQLNYTSERNFQEEISLSRKITWSFTLYLVVKISYHILSY